MSKIILKTSKFPYKPSVHEKAFITAKRFSSISKAVYALRRTNAKAATEAQWATLAGLYRRITIGSSKGREGLGDSETVMKYWKEAEKLSRLDAVNKYIKIARKLGIEPQ